MFAGANKDLSIADRWCGAEVFGVDCETIGGQLFERIVGLQNMDVPRPSDVIDLAVADYG